MVPQAPLQYGYPGRCLTMDAEQVQHDPTEGLDHRSMIPYFHNYQNMESGMDQDQVIRALGALAQEHRLAAFRLLVQAGPEGLAAGAIGEALGVPASSLSFHLAQLAHAGLVLSQRQGRSIRYRADYAAMNGVLSYLTENCCGGAPCADESPCAAPSAYPRKDVA